MARGTITSKLDFNPMVTKHIIQYKIPLSGLLYTYDKTAHRTRILQ